MKHSTVPHYFVSKQRHNLVEDTFEINTSGQIWLLLYSVVFCSHHFRIAEKKIFLWVMEAGVTDISFFFISNFVLLLRLGQGLSRLMGLSYSNVLFHTKSNCVYIYVRIHVRSLNGTGTYKSFTHSASICTDTTYAHAMAHTDSVLKDKESTLIL